jgi:hypothetical protein
MRADLVIEALAIAARNYPLAEAAIFHSDRGTQYQCRLVKVQETPFSSSGMPLRSDSHLARMGAVKMGSIFVEN